MNEKPMSTNAEEPLNFLSNIQPKESSTPEPEKTTRRGKPKKQKNTSYWGLTPLFISFILYLILQLASSILISILIIVQHADELLNSTKTPDEIIYSALGDYPQVIIIMQIVLYFIWIGSAAWVSRYRSDVPKKRTFWQAFKKNFYLESFKKRDILYGIGIAVGFFVILNLLSKLFEWLSTFAPFFNMEGSSNVQMFENLNGFWFYVIGFGIGGLLGPIVEEVFFRGFITRGLLNHFSLIETKDYRAMDDFERQSLEKLPALGSATNMYRVWVDKHKSLLALIISSVIFGFMHFQGSETFGQWFVVIGTGLLGLILGIVVQKTQRLYPAMIAHITYNTLNFVLLFITMSS
jgi:membrane protease YdiL (CAAX protease family)